MDIVKVQDGIQHYGEGLEVGVRHWHEWYGGITMSETGKDQHPEVWTACDEGEKLSCLVSVQ